MSEEKFSEDYYERGVEKKISGYTNYGYMPTRSYEEASSIIKRFPIVYSVLDFGCAKGYLVHALRQLGLDAYGEDISDYAINNCHSKVANYVKKISPDDKNPLTFKEYDLIICKDVMEHIPEEEIPAVLNHLKCRMNRYSSILFVIPLGDNDQFRIREYEIDITHVTKKDEDWWIDTFRNNGLIISDFSYSMEGIKKKWKDYEYGNGFFIVHKLDSESVLDEQTK